MHPTDSVQEMPFLTGFLYIWICTNHKLTPLLPTSELLDSCDVNVIQYQELKMNCSPKPYSEQKLCEICLCFVCTFTFYSLEI